MNRIYQLELSTRHTYGVMAAFIGANVVFPQLFHLVPGGGVAWLPIYFFTLVGAYKYGWKVGVLTAVASPLSGYALFGMPMWGLLPSMLLKSVLLALFASGAACRVRNVSLPLMGAVVLSYQLAGGLTEWILCGDAAVAFQDFRTGIPGMLLQIIGGYALLSGKISRWMAK
ncbi:MAG: ECF transporter S component [Prevotellaceae bacterium]|nr:ECF transporter S component [Prevotellaceae bacterium]